MQGYSVINVNGIVWVFYSGICTCKLYKNILLAFTSGTLIRNHYESENHENTMKISMDFSQDFHGVIMPFSWPAWDKLHHKKNIIP